MEQQVKYWFWWEGKTGLNPHRKTSWSKVGKQPYLNPQMTLSQVSNLGHICNQGTRNVGPLIAMTTQLYKEHVTWEGLVQENVLYSWCWYCRYFKACEHWCFFLATFVLEGASDQTGLARLKRMLLITLRIWFICKWTHTQTGADHLKHATPILSQCHGIFTDWSIFSIPFLFQIKAVPLQWRSAVN